MYDYAHPLSDAIEKVTHSICTLEFQDHRPFYDWCIENVFIGFVRGGTDFTGRALRLLQNGNLQTYTFLFALGVALVLFLVLGK